MLPEALVERYSRQILLPEVGGRGQERLRAASVTVAGGGDAGTFAATLLGGAGVTARCEPGPDDELRIATTGTAGVRARWNATAAVVATLPGMPCVACVPTSRLVVPGVATAATAPALAQVAGALAAAETLRLLLGLADAGRLQTIDVTSGIATGTPLARTPGCARCGASA